MQTCVGGQTTKHFTSYYEPLFKRQTNINKVTEKQYMYMQDIIKVSKQCLLPANKKSVKY